MILNNPNMANNQQHTPIKKKKKKRCQHKGCRKKLGLTSWNCKCGKKFCDKHHSAEIHSCEFNWEEDAKIRLTKTMLEGKTIDNRGLVSI